MGYCEAFQEYEEGIQYGASILAIDSARERTHRRLMRLHYLAGDRTSALRQYQRCTHALQQDLGVKPAHSTHHVYEQIRADSLTDEFLNHPTATPKPHNLSQTLFQLKQVQTLLDGLQSQLQYQIKSVQAIIDQQ
jgi:DNA-binding SARP family transcriptional activator